MPRDHLEGNLRRRVRSMVAGAVDAAAVREPVALGEHADDFRPRWVSGVGPVGGDIPFVRTQSPQAICSTAVRCTPGRAELRQLVERTVVVRERGRARSCRRSSRSSRHARGSSTCSHASLRGARCDGCRRGRSGSLPRRRARNAFGSLPAAVQRVTADPSSQARHCNGRALPVPDAACEPRSARSPRPRARPSCPPLRARVDRACPCPQPSATMSTTTPPPHFAQSSLLPAAAIGAGSAAPDLRRVEARSRRAC